jgi:DNA-binding HxlR family transcriptional regulator
MEGCPVKFALGLVSGKWKLRILWELNQQEVIRFNELQRRLEGISSVMLSKSLEPGWSTGSSIPKFRPG